MRLCLLFFLLWCFPKAVFAQGTFPQDVTVSIDTTLTSSHMNHWVNVTAGAGGITLTLPANASWANSYTCIWRVDAEAGNLTITSAGADTINGVTSIALPTQYQWACLTADGAGLWEAFGVNESTGDQKAALAGTSGTAPSVTNKYVDDADARNTNARTPVAHASNHQNGGSDEVATATAGANAIPKAGAGGTLANSWTTATDTNTASTIVARDASGNFSAGTITASLTGTASACATGDSATSFFSTGTIEAARLPTPAVHTHALSIIIGADNGAVLVDGDDQPTVYRFSAASTITAVWCESDGGTPSINLQRDDGSAANLLSANLSCSTAGAAGTIDTIEDNFAAGNILDFVMVTAGGTAKRVTVSVEYTVD